MGPPIFLGNAGAFRIRVEEQVFSKDLAEAYGAYVRRMRRLIPSLL
jgi:protein-S-isoprenylcysteine O-methyltransferase Ste14